MHRRKGKADLLGWCNKGHNPLKSLRLAGSKDQLKAKLENHKNYFKKTVYLKSILQIKNNMDKNTDVNEGIDLPDLKQRMNTMNRAQTH